MNQPSYMKFNGTKMASNCKLKTQEVLSIESKELKTPLLILLEDITLTRKNKSYQLYCIVVCSKSTHLSYFKNLVPNFVFSFLFFIQGTCAQNISFHLPCMCKWMWPLVVTSTHITSAKHEFFYILMI